MRPSARFLSVFAATLLAVVGLLVAPSPAQAAESRVVCNHDWVRVRAAATTSSSELGRLTRGTEVTGAREGAWFRLADGGYVAAYYTCTGGDARAVQPAAAPGADFWTVCRTPWVRVRAAATTSSRELRRLDQGAPMSGTMQGGWLRLDGDAGFVAAHYVCPAPSTALVQPTGTLGSPTTPFGQRFHPILQTWRWHNGIDIGNRANQPIRAAEAGVVTVIARDDTAGLYVKINHNTVAGTPHVGTGYLHMASTAVASGQRVERGQVIGHVGSTGLSTKPHLHFIVYESGTPVNPEKYLGPLSSLRH